nr:SMR family transporter [Gordonia humi]
MSLAIVSELAATLCLRASDGMRRRLWLIPTAFGYVASFVLLSLTLAAGVPVAIAYGVWTAVGIAAVALLARIVWRDPLTPRMMIGIAIIILGVVLIEAG